MKNKSWIIATSIITFLLLSIVQIIVKPPLLLGERLFSGGGWIQILMAALLSGWLYHKMSPRATRSIWRKRIWLIFSIVFFGQLLLGITIDSIFLLSGTLHFPIPGLIPLGAVYRWQLSFMPVLFLTTILLSGGAWCSQLCYFGAFDSISAGHGKNRTIQKKQRIRIRFSILVLFTIVAIILRLCSLSSLPATILAAAMGIVGLLIILIFSRKYNIMVHCTTYCPAGTLVAYLKYLSPWRFRIDTRQCTRCMACARSCRYDALQKQNILQGSPGISCTYCGDCLVACSHQALGYRIFNLSTNRSEKLWLCTTIILFTCFLMIARI